MSCLTRRSPARRLDDQRGQSTVLAAAVLALAGVALYVLARFAGGLVDAAEARTAADAAALAGVTGGQPAAHRLAALNGGELLEFTAAGSDVIVTVRVGRAVATARAGSEPISPDRQRAATRRAPPFTLSRRGPRPAHL